MSPLREVLWRATTHHAQLGELLDLLDRARGALLEAHAVDLCVCVFLISLPSQMPAKKSGPSDGLH